MAELRCELMVASDEAGKEASTQAPNNETYQFLLGVSIGLDRALNILQRKIAALQPNVANPSERANE